MWKDAKTLIEEIEHRKNRGNTLEHLRTIWKVWESS